MIKKRTKRDFFEWLGPFSVTFDDAEFIQESELSLATGYSEVLPVDVDVSSLFSQNIPLKIPFVSAAMDTVTEAELAIALAKEGGIGVIHRNLTPEQQAAEVARVKHYFHGGLIDKPICVRETWTFEELLKFLTEKKFLVNDEFKFYTFPVINDAGKLVGMITYKHFKFNSGPEDWSQKIKDIMETDVVSEVGDPGADRAFEIMKRRYIGVLPILHQDGTIGGLYVFTDLKRKRKGANMHNTDTNGQLRVAAAIGVGKDELERAERLVWKKVDALVLDTAHADTEGVIRMLGELTSAYPNVDVVVGNISEASSVEGLIRAGARGIKVGQGPGSICTTRMVAGVGLGQITAVYYCSEAASRYNVPVCADGGVRYTGDVPKAIGAGAHCVMMGKTFAGTKEAPGDKIFLNGREYKTYRGMGSLGAMQESAAARERYGQQNSPSGKLVPEGVEGIEPYKGYLTDVLSPFIGGLKAGMGYVGGKNIEELRQKATFWLASPGTARESRPHDIIITKEAPNYSPNGE